MRDYPATAIGQILQVRRQHFSGGLQRGGKSWEVDCHLLPQVCDKEVFFLPPYAFWAHALRHASSASCPSGRTHFSRKQLLVLATSYLFVLSRQLRPDLSRRSSNPTECSSPRVHMSKVGIDPFWDKAELHSSGLR